MARTPSDFAELFVVQLNAKHDGKGYTFSAMAGNKFDRIVITNTGYPSVHAFVEKTTGHVYKAAGWVQPAKGVRYVDVFAASEASDVYGSYLYR